MSMYIILLFFLAFSFRRHFDSERAIDSMVSKEEMEHTVTKDTGEQKRESKISISFCLDKNAFHVPTIAAFTFIWLRC